MPGESLQLGDRAVLRKPHACGGFEWEVVRLGADIGLKCLKCGRRVLLPRDQFERRAKSIAHPSHDPT
ncbi:MAG: DUF951 domain-containing protein [Armatimonadetes bacterium]|nr:DUF951 domain-containing protein [Armatimonadota bacterium]